MIMISRALGPIRGIRLIDLTLANCVRYIHTTTVRPVKLSKQTKQTNTCSTPSSVLLD